jgi:hypothetical protein
VWIWPELHPYYLGFLEPVAQAASERFEQHCLADLSGGNQ